MSQITTCREQIEGSRLTTGPLQWGGGDKRGGWGSMGTGLGALTWTHRLNPPCMFGHGSEVKGEVAG